MKKQKNIILIIVIIVLIITSFFLGLNFKKIEKTVKHKHPLIDMPIKDTNLPQLASFFADSTYVVCILSYNCSSCWDYIGNLNQYESSENIDKVIAFAVGDNKKNDLIKYFNPKYEIKNCKYEDISKLTKVSPTILYIKNDTIKYVIMGAIPSLYNLEKNYFNN
ncbi:MAG: hypothetical protein H6Q16_120 [Bacteroidetes bacterium]|nr:hypothetical protein [Bacteroidota bacterium]